MSNRQTFQQHNGKGEIRRVRKSDNAHLIDVGNAIINLTARDKANHRSMFHSSSTSIFQIETKDAHGLIAAHVQVAGAISLVKISYF